MVYLILDHSQFDIYGCFFASHMVSFVDRINTRYIRVAIQYPDSEIEIISGDTKNATYHRTLVPNSLESPQVLARVSEKINGDINLIGRRTYITRDEKTVKGGKKFSASIKSTVAARV